MALRVIMALAATLVLSALGASAAGAASVAYVDNNNLWVSSPDGSKKIQLTTDGNDDTKWSWPSQGPDGKTVAVFGNSGSSTKALYLFDPSGKRVTGNVMPVYSGATIPVYPIGLDMDWNSQAVAYGYSYCTFACNSVVQGFWLTFSDNQGLYPSDPQGQSDAHLPTFFGKRVIYSDSGGQLFIQPDVPEAPFTSSYEGWLGDQNLFLSRAAAAQTGNQVAIEWSDRNSTTNSGILVGQRQGPLPSTVDSLCDLPVVGESGNVSFSPDGQFVAWADTEGVKVAGAPNLAAGTQACTLSSPVQVISPTGKYPDFGGATVTTMVEGGTGPGPGGGGSSGVAVKAKGKPTWRTFVRGDLAIVATVANPGRVDASASLARNSVRALASGGLAAAKAVVVARGRKRAAKAGKVTIKLKPTRAAKRAGRRLKGKKLAVTVSQGAARGKLSVKLR